MRPNLAGIRRPKCHDFTPTTFYVHPRCCLSPTHPRPNWSSVLRTSTPNVDVLFRASQLWAPTHVNQVFLAIYGGLFGQPASRVSIQRPHTTPRKERTSSNGGSFHCARRGSSIIALLEFSWKLLADTRTIYKSATGVGEDHALLSTIAEDVRRLSDTITCSPASCDDLKALVAESRAVAEHLLKVVTKLQVQGEKNAWNSFRAALKSVWKRGEIEAFSQRLAKLQGQIASHVQLLIL